MNDALLVPMALFLGLSISRAEPNTNFTALAQRAASAIATSPALPAKDVIDALAEGQTGSLFAGRVPFDASMATGFLYGDAMMFYATTWARHEYKKASN